MSIDLYSELLNQASTNRLIQRSPKGTFLYYVHLYRYIYFQIPYFPSFSPPALSFRHHLLVISLYSYKLIPMATTLSSLVSLPFHTNISPISKSRYQNNRYFLRLLGSSSSSPLPTSDLLCIYSICSALSKHGQILTQKKKMLHET